MIQKQTHDPITYMDQDQARYFMEMVISHLADWPIKSAAGFRNAILGKNATIAINPMLDIKEDTDVDFLRSTIQNVVADGCMIDFGFIPNELIKQESIRSRHMFESGEFQHPYDTWLGISSWEGGMCGYLFTPHPENPKQIICIEIYGVEVPNAAGVILVYDIISVEVKGPDNTVVHPAPVVAKDYGDDIAALNARGANSVDPMVTMLRLLADASIPIVDHPAPEKLNRARAKRGEFLIPDHTAVLTKDYVSSFQTARSGGHPEKGTHASPIAHWRRAHKRLLADGRIVPVRSSKVNWRDREEIHRLFYRVST